jgi:hypothetical protein
LFSCLIVIFVATVATAQATNNQRQPVASTTAHAVDCSTTVATASALNAAISCFNAQSSGTHVVTFSADITLNAASTAINNPTTAHLTLSGANQFTLSGNGSYRSLTIDAGNVHIDQLTIANGSVNMSNGAAIFNAGTLSVTDSAILNNTAADGFGGGIHNSGSLTVRSSHFAGNAADGEGGGGGIHNAFGSTLVVIDSTFANNSAEIFGGGGLYNEFSATATISNSILSQNYTSDSVGGGIQNEGIITISGSTLAGNRAFSDGGGIYNSGDATILSSSIVSSTAFSGGGIYTANRLALNNSTLSNNMATTQGGGIHNPFGGELTLRNSTLSGNAANAGGGIYNDGTVDLDMISNSIIANSTSGGDCSGVGFFAFTHSLVKDGSCANTSYGDNLLHVDPKLGPLTNNGGSTHTHALLSGSPAIDAGDNAVCVAEPINGRDQRGAARPAGAACDIGAVEADSVPTAVTARGFSAETPPAVSYWIVFLLFISTIALLAQQRSKQIA